MDEVPPDFRLLRFSTDNLELRDRFEGWRDVLIRNLLRVSIDPLSEEPFSAKVMMRAQHGFRLALGEFDATISRRTRGAVAADNDDLALMVNLGSPLTLLSQGGELVLNEGDASLVSCVDLADVVRPARGRQLCIRMPRAAIASLVPDVEVMTKRLIPRQTDPLRLLINYAASLYEDDDIAMSPGASDAVVRHISDLVALSLGAGRNAAVAAAGGLRAARLASVKAIVGGNLGREGLSVDEVAAAVGVSARYVRRLFEGEGENFSGYLAAQRLQRAHALLVSPAAAAMTIAMIAFEVGFGDLSYFNRRFREAFHATPTDVRAAARAASQPAMRSPVRPPVSPSSYS